MNYYIMYKLQDDTFRIKHFEGYEENILLSIREFIENRRTEGCYNFCIKRSSIPFAYNVGQNIMPILNILNEEDFENLDAEDITHIFF